MEIAAVPVAVYGTPTKRGKMMYEMCHYRTVRMFVGVGYIEVDSEIDFLSKDDSPSKRGMGFVRIVFIFVTALAQVRKSWRWT